MIPIISLFITQMQLFHYQKAYLYKSFACIDKNTSLGTQFPSCYTGFIRAINSNSQIALHDSIFNCKADIRNPLSLLAHERSRFATCQWELLTPTDISIPLTPRLVLYTLEAGECLFCVQIFLTNQNIPIHLCFQFCK